jgi:hypothetical protein
MSDPVLIKLKADAGIVLADLWRALTHQAPLETREEPKVGAEVDLPERASNGSRVAEPKQVGFCCVHLN